MTTSKTKTPKKMSMAIVGFGRFGKTLYRLLEKDFLITIFNRTAKPPKDFLVGSSTRITTDLSEVYESDVVFYAVPIGAFDSVIRGHKKYFRPGQLLIDVLSVKVHPKNVFAKHLQGTQTRALLTHPMFGPDSSKEGFKDLRIVMDHFMANQSEYDFWKKFFKAKGLTVVEMSAERHDQLAARSQGVAHFIGRILAEFKFSKTPIDTRGAEDLYRLMEQTSNDTWELFTNLQNYNSYTKDMRLKLGVAYDKLFNQLLPDRVDPKYLVFGIQGGVGSFNEQAITHYLTENKITDFKIKYLYTSEKVLKNVHEGNLDYGLFAISNSLGGVVEESVQAMAEYKFKIAKEVLISIEHFLMKRKDVSLKSISKIMAHSQVFKQCMNTLQKKFSHLRLESGKGDRVDTAKAAQALAEGKLPKTTAILGPKRLAEIYDFEIIAENLQDDKTNTTRFLLVTR